MLKSVYFLFYCFILNQKHIKHADDKKTILAYIYSYVLNNFKLSNNSIEKNISDLYSHEVNSKCFVTYSFIMHNEHFIY